MKEEISDENNKTCSSEVEDPVVVTMDLFVGNLSLYTTEPKLQAYFSSFGTVSSVKICTHPENGKNKRFGFLNFDNMDVISKILNYPRHEIDGKVLEIRYASKNILNKRKAGLLKVKPEGPEGPEDGGTKESLTPAKIFVGGVSQNAKVEDLRLYFSSFGPVLNVTLLPDHITGRHRGFGFVTFENESTAEVVCASRYHTIKMKKVECKKASSSRNLKGVDKKSSSTSSEALVSPQWLLDPNNKSPGLMGQHPWQNLNHSSNTNGGLLLNPSPYALYPSPFSFTPIYIDPLMSFGSSSHHTPLGVSHHYKLLNHRFISDSSIRYSPYSLGSGGSRVHSTGVGDLAYQAGPPLLLPNIPVGNSGEAGSVEEPNIKQNSEQLHAAPWAGGHTSSSPSFLPPARKI